MIRPFKTKLESPTESKWIQPDCQWGVGDRCCLFGCQVVAGNAPPKDLILIVSAVFEGKLFGTEARSVGLNFANWPNPVNSDYNGWTALAFRKVMDVKQAEETSIGEKTLKAKPAPDIKRTKPAKVAS